MAEKNCCEISDNRIHEVVEADYGHTVRPMIHCDRTADFHVMIYLLEGCMEIIEDGICYRLLPGDLFFLKRGVHHWGEKPFAYGTSWYYAHFLTSGEGEECLTLPKLWHFPVQCPVKEKFEKLLERHRQGRKLETGLLLWGIFLDVIGSAEGQHPLAEGKVEPLLIFLQEHYAENFTAQELKGAVGFSYKYAGTLLKAHTGMTIKEYQLMLKLRRAESLLCGSEMTVAEIAAETGFYDAFYFSRIFKREKGMSPTAFRRSYEPRI